MQGDLGFHDQFASIRAKRVDTNLDPLMCTRPMPGRIGIARHPWGQVFCVHPAHRIPCRFAFQRIIHQTPGYHRPSVVQLPNNRTAAPRSIPPLSTYGFVHCIGLQHARPIHPILGRSRIRKSSKGTQIIPAQIFRNRLETTWVILMRP